MHKSLITVFTATYNRAHTLGRTYDSLCRQTCKDFEWLVVDDGSTDGTRDLVAGWIAEGKIPIRYIWKENGGLHTGYNTAIAHINTELTMCVDSDDWLVDNAIELLKTFWNTERSDNLAGIVALDCFEDGTPIGGKFPQNVEFSYIINMSRYHRGDVKMIHRTELLKQFIPMPSVHGEKFANPIYIFLQVDKKMPLKVLNENICVVEYQDGNNSMSRNIWYQYLQSPRSFANLRLSIMDHPQASVLIKFKYTIHYISSCIIARDRQWLKRHPYKWMCFIALPLALLFYVVVVWKNRNKTNYK